LAVCLRRSRAAHPEPCQPVVGDDPAVAEADAAVKTHVSRAMAKLDARDRAQLVVLAYETGLVAPGGA
jgi:hypothetical protein